MHLGFIGLGTMGTPMATHLVKAGHAMTVWARREAGAAPLVAAGAQLAGSPRDVGAAAEVVFTMVTTSADSEAVILGADGREGIAHGLRAGGMVVDMATIALGAARRIAKALAERGIEYVDAPVSGGPQGAREATLSIMAGGTPAAFARARPLLETLGRTVQHMGASGAGQVTKACNQLALCVTAQGVAEALTFAAANGLDPVRVREVMAGGVAASRVLDLFGTRMAARDFGPGIDARFYHKDVGIVLDLAQEMGLPLPAAALVKQQLNALMGAGQGEQDFSALITVLERMQGRD
ncbi:MAG: NAD(P)-dependent oxidoreductase [Burkholderiales bacterium]